MDDSQEQQGSQEQSIPEEQPQQIAEQEQEELARYKQAHRQADEDFEQQEKDRQRKGCTRRASIRTIPSRVWVTR